MPIQKEQSLDYALSALSTGELVFLSDFPEYDVAFTCRVLAKKCKNKEFIKLSRGIYYKPKMTQFGPLLPPVNEVIKAIARRDSAKILPTGETALNQLGLSTQVPMKMVYLTNASARELKIGGIKVKLKRSAPKNFAFKDDFYALLHQALKALGKDNITNENMNQIRYLLQRYTNNENNEHDFQLMPLWMRKIIIQLSNR